MIEVMVKARIYHSGYIWCLKNLGKPTPINWLHYWDDNDIDYFAFVNNNDAVRFKLIFG